MGDIGTGCYSDQGYTPSVPLPDREDVAAALQLRLHRFAYPRVDRQAAELGFRLAKRAGVMRGRESRGHECVFRRHTEVHHLEDQLDGRLVLEVSTGDRDGRHWFAVL